MILNIILTSFMFSFHYSPYLVVEKSLVKHSDLDTLRNTWGYAVLQSEDILSIGIAVKEKHLYSNISLGTPWSKNMKFLPYFDLNTGGTLKNFSAYIGYLFYMKNEPQINESNTIYSGINYFQKKNNFRVSFDLQLSRGYFLYVQPALKVDTFFVNANLTAKIEYPINEFKPHLYLSIGKRTNCGLISFAVGLGFALGKSPITTTKYKSIIYYSHIIRNLLN